MSALSPGNDNAPGQLPAAKALSQVPVPQVAPCWAGTVLNNADRIDLHQSIDRELRP